MALSFAHIHLDFTIAAPVEKVWESLVLETNQWWLPDFYATQDPEGIFLEPRPGGRLYEEGANGAGVLWYTVVEVRPPNILSLSGDLGPPYGGPATSMLRIEIASHLSGSLLNLDDSLFGMVDKKAELAIRDGWKALFGELKNFAESQ